MLINFFPSLKRFKNTNVTLALQHMEVLSYKGLYGKKHIWIDFKVFTEVLEGESHVGIFKRLLLQLLKILSA